MATHNMMDLAMLNAILTNKSNFYETMTHVGVMVGIKLATSIGTELIPVLKARATEYWNRRLDAMTERIKGSMGGGDNTNVAELTFERDYTKSDNWDRADAVLSRVLSIPESNDILVIGQLELVKNKGTFEIAPDIDFTLLDLQIDSDRGIVKKIKFKVSSVELDVCDLRDYIGTLVEEFLVAKRNNLGDKLFYFDQIIPSSDSGSNGGGQGNVRPGVVTFSKHLFVTNRNLDNVFHERSEELKQRVKFFLNEREWYDKRGIPHTIGFMFSGEKGTGKTSSIKAIARESNRHILNVNFASIKSAAQLKKLFYDERITVCENPDSPGSTVDYIIPINKRLYVLEDIDASSQDFLMKRKYQTNPVDLSMDSTNVNDVKRHAMPGPGTLPFVPAGVLSGTNKSDVNLALVLGILDGTLEIPGRMIIVTTNFPGKLDEAFIRPGRIDMAIEFKKCNRQVIREMFISFYESQPDSVMLDQIKEYTWTPAEVAQILFKNFGKPENALRDLIEIDPSKYFKFEERDSDSNDSDTENTKLVNDGDYTVIGDTVPSNGPSNGATNNTDIAAQMGSIVKTAIESVASVMDSAMTTTTQRSLSPKNDTRKSKLEPQKQSTSTVIQESIVEQHTSQSQPSSSKPAKLLMPKLQLETDPRVDGFSGPHYKKLIEDTYFEKQVSFIAEDPAIRTPGKFMSSGLFSLIATGQYHDSMDKIPRQDIAKIFEACDRDKVSEISKVEALVGLAMLKLRRDQGLLSTAYVAEIPDALWVYAEQLFNVIDRTGTVNIESSETMTGSKLHMPPIAASSLPSSKSNLGKSVLVTSDIGHRRDTRHLRDRPGHHNDSFSETDTDDDEVNTDVADDPNERPGVIVEKPLVESQTREAEIIRTQHQQEVLAMANAYDSPVSSDTTNAKSNGLLMSGLTFKMTSSFVGPARRSIGSMETDADLENARRLPPGFEHLMTTNVIARMNDIPDEFIPVNAG